MTKRKTEGRDREHQPVETSSRTPGGSKTIALMLESDGPGGAEWLLLRLAEELRNRGHLIVPVGPKRGVGWLREKFCDHGFEPRTFDIRRPVDWRCARDMTHMLKAANVEIVHSHEFTMAVYGTVASRRLRIPHVITMHGNQQMTAVWRRRMALRWAFRRSKVVTAVSQVTARQIEHDLGLADGMIKVILNGVPRVDGDPRDVRKELGLLEDEIIILSVGNLDRRKGHMVLLRALQGLPTEGTPQWRVVIAGGRGGPEREALEAFATEHGFRDRLSILSQRDDVPDLLAAADIFVMPSLWEGLPLALLEAMLAGKAIVASATSGIPEAITTGEDGLLVPPGDLDALRLGLQKVLCDEEFREAIGGRARTRGLEHFTVEAMTDGYERLY